MVLSLFCKTSAPCTQVNVKISQSSCQWWAWPLAVADFPRTTRNIVPKVSKDDFTFLFHWQKKYIHHYVLIWFIPNQCQCSSELIPFEMMIITHGTMFTKLLYQVTQVRWKWRLKEGNIPLKGMGWFDENCKNCSGNVKLNDKCHMCRQWTCSVRPVHWICETDGTRYQTFHL